MITQRRYPDAIGVVQVPLLLTLNIFHTLPGISIANFEQINAGWINSNVRK